MVSVPEYRPTACPASRSILRSRVSVVILHPSQKEPSLPRTACAVEISIRLFWELPEKLVHTHWLIYASGFFIKTLAALMV